MNPISEDSFTEESAEITSSSLLKPIWSISVAFVSAALTEPIEIIIAKIKTIKTDLHLIFNYILL